MKSSAVSAVEPQQFEPTDSGMFKDKPARGENSSHPESEGRHRSDVDIKHCHSLSRVPVPAVEFSVRGATQNKIIQYLSEKETNT